VFGRALTFAALALVLAANRWMALTSGPFSRPEHRIPYEEIGCTMYTWRIDERRLIVIRADGGPEFVPVLRGANAQSMNSVMARWTTIASPIATSKIIPFEVILAMIWQESKGNPGAFRQEPDGQTGIGLMQITNRSLKAGHSDVELYDPKLNIRIGTEYVAVLVNRYGTDWPKIFAAFNSGSVRPSTKNQWGMVCTHGHVDGEVAAYNYAIEQELDAAQRALMAQFDLRDIVDPLARRTS